MNSSERTRTVFILIEKEVEDHVRKWLQRRWDKKPIDLVEGADVDFLVAHHFRKPSWLINYECVECKGTKSHVHRAIGQSLDYYWVYGRIPTYLAVPDDYKKLETIERIIAFFGLPIGILLVSNNGVISLKRKAKGKARYFKLFQKEKNGDLINRPP